MNPDTLAASVRAPFSLGSGRTPVAIPALACDCHVHVYDARSEAVVGARLTPPDASPADYRLLQARTGTQRAVFVTPSTYGTDNRPMLDGLTALGAKARGVAVIDASASDATLEALHRAGVRGVRLNLSLGVGTQAEHLAPLAARIAPWGWHLQLLAPLDQLVGLAPVLQGLPVPVVFDHFSRLRPSMAGRHPAHALILGLLRAGKAWVKLSGGYIVTEQGPPHFGDLTALARSFLQAAPDRIVWGSDWPHASASAGLQAMPDDALQMTLLADWVGDATALRRVLVDNPAALYDFPTA